MRLMRLEAVICEEARLVIGADPETDSEALREHLQSCPGCRDYHSAMTELQRRLRRALALGPPLPPAPPAPRTHAGRLRARAWTLAASVLAATAAALLLWTGMARDTLARDLGDHIALERRTLSRTRVVPAEKVEGVLRKAHAVLASGQDRVVFAHVCWVRRHWVPHLVVRTDQGPVTVLLLTEERVDTASTFHEAGFTGVLLPAPRGSLAVLSQQEGMGIAAARQIAQAIRWLPD